MKPNKQSQKKMLFTPDPGKKREILRHQVDSNKKLKVADFLGKIMLVSGIVAAIAYFLVNIAINSWSISYSTGAPKTPYGTVIVASLAILGVGALIFGVIQSVVYTKAGKDITTRHNEIIEMDGQDIRYTYTAKKNSAEKGVTVIPLREIVVRYEPKARKLEMYGPMKVNHIKQIDGKQKSSASELSEFVIYDYFDPSLHLALQKSAVKFKTTAEEEAEEYV